MIGWAVQSQANSWSVPAASSAAAGVDLLFFALTAICGAATFGIAIAIVYFAIKYRHGSAADRTPSRISHRKIEYVWVFGSLLIFLMLFLWAAGVFLYIKRDQGGEPMKIQVVAKQWMWKFQHPGGQAEIDELHVPAGVPIELSMISQDVIHSLFVPAFRVKQDVLPRRTTRLRFTATRPGVYHLFCAEYCGTRHSGMRGWVYVLPPDQYQRWLAGQGAPMEPTLAQRGEAVFMRLGCTGCHVDTHGPRGPSLVGVFGSRVRTAAGPVVVADEAYLRDSILLPNKHVVAGYEPIMPTYDGVVEEAQLHELIEYLKSISRADANASAAGVP